MERSSYVPSGAVEGVPSSRYPVLIPRLRAFGAALGMTKKSVAARDRSATAGLRDARSGRVVRP